MKKAEIIPSIGYYVKTSREFEGAKYDSIRLNNLVDNFYNTLNNKLEDSDLNLLKYNIDTLKVVQKRMGILVKGDYNTYSNTIRITKINDAATFNHEMLHMATSFYDSSNDIAYTGFFQEKGKYSIGVGINEGYTELQNMRLFYDEDSDTEYEYDVIIAFLVERIVGRTKMEKLFFNADLLGLIKELKRYYEGIEAEKFISYLDDLHDYRYQYNLTKKETIRNKIAFINQYLLSTYVEKLKIDIQSGKIDKETACKYYQEFYYTLCDTIKYLPPRTNYSYGNLHELTKRKTLNSK